MLIFEPHHQIRDLEPYVNTVASDQPTLQSTVNANETILYCRFTIDTVASGHTVIMIQC